MKDYDTTCASLKRWRTRLKRAINMVDKLEKRRARLEKRILDTRGTDAPAQPVAKPASPQAHTLPQESARKAPAVPLNEATPENIIAAAQAVVAERDLDIPDYLKRAPKKTDEEAAAEVKAAKAAKTKGRIDKLKALKTERDALGSIPKSQLRWDTSKSQWVSEA